ncbi:unnamed protein product [Lampetra fluviatilis]
MEERRPLEEEEGPATPAEAAEAASRFLFPQKLPIQRAKLTSSSSVSSSPRPSCFNIAASAAQKQPGAPHRKRSNQRRDNIPCGRGAHDPPRDHDAVPKSSVNYPRRGKLQKSTSSLGGGSKHARTRACTRADACVSRRKLAGARSGLATIFAARSQERRLAIVAADAATAVVE